MTAKQKKIRNTIIIFIALWLATWFFHEIFDFTRGIIRAFIIATGGAVWYYKYK